MRPRLPPRTSGPLIDWCAFREPVWNLFIMGWWLVMWANYFTFYYVGLSLSSSITRVLNDSENNAHQILTSSLQIASFAREALGLSYSSATILVIIVNGAGLPFRVAVPLFSDASGPLNVLVPVTFLWAVIAFCWLAVPTVPGYYVWTAFYGALSASFQCLTATAVTSITPSLDKVGTRMGMAFGIISFASMTGPPVGGALLNADGGAYAGAQIWAACATMVGFALCTLARCVKAGGINLKAKC